MDLRQLRYFAAVAENRSFSKAARELRIAQPALSQHVRHMEDELGVLLLYRGAHGVVPTEAGERLLLHIQRILAEFAEIPDSVRDAATPIGEVRIGLSGTAGQLLPAPLIEAARARYPDVRIRIVEGMSDHVRQWVKEGEVDLAMIYIQPETSGLAIHHGLSDEVWMFASPTLQQIDPARGSIPLKEAMQLPLIMPGNQNGLRMLFNEAAQSIGHSVSPAYEIDSRTQIKTLVLRGLGYGILPWMSIRKETEAGIFNAWHITDPIVTRTLYLAYSTERPLSNATKAICDLSWDVLRQLVQDRKWMAKLTSDSGAALRLVES